MAARLATYLLEGPHVEGRHFLLRCSKADMSARLQCDGLCRAPCGTHAAGLDAFPQGTCERLVPELNLREQDTRDRDGGWRRSAQQKHARRSRLSHPEAACGCFDNGMKLGSLCQSCQLKPDPALHARTCATGTATVAAQQGFICLLSSRQ